MKAEESSAQTFGQKMALAVIILVMEALGTIFVLAEVPGGGVWLHTIGMLLVLSGIILVDEIKEKREFWNQVKSLFE